MKIVVRSHENRDLHVQLPTGLILNPVSALFLPKALQKNGMGVSRAQALALVRAINRYRRSHPGWVLVEVEGADGDYINITV